ncbi:unnamed protein product [marine sediment metagenome]|uniref:TNase-like domain-containing protein n=1 Tax=marine sediment metagenome TaxID=412755 RepID=X0YEB8_9ZZZZ
MPEAFESYNVIEWSVYDGDTVNAMLSATVEVLGIEIHLAVPVAVRVANIDTPELRDKRQRPAGEVAKQVAIRWFECNEMDGITFVFQERDKYAGRVVGDFRNLCCPGGTLSEYQLACKVAHSYDGGTKEKWTDEELKRIEGVKP